MPGKTKHILSVLFIAGLILSVSSARPAVVLAFDDGWTSQYYKAFSIMEANNQKGTDFIITGEVAGATGQSGNKIYLKDPANSNDTQRILDLFNFIF